MTRQIAAGKAGWTAGWFDNAIAAALYQQATFQVFAAGGSTSHGEHMHNRGFWQHHLEYGDTDSRDAGILYRIMPNFSADIFDNGPPDPRYYDTSYPGYFTDPNTNRANQWYRYWRENAYCTLMRL